MNLVGRWRIETMDLWDRDAINLVESGFIELDADGTGQFGFIAVRSWQGGDEGDDVCGHGWAALTDDGTLNGHLFFHLGDDSGFHAVPFDLAAGRDAR